MRGTSNAPLILGIIGSILLIPGMFCVTRAGVLVQSGTIIFIGILPMVTGIAGAVLGKSKPTLSMILFIFSAVLTGLYWSMTAFISKMHMVALILFVIAAVKARMQRMDGTENGISFRTRTRKQKTR